MDDAKERGAGCPEYRIRVEEFLIQGLGLTDAEPELAEHFRICPSCRELAEENELAGEIVRIVCEPPGRIEGAFVTRVMAAVRQEDSRRAAVGAIWRPIEFLASRFAVAASVLLLAASVYLVEFAPPFNLPPSRRKRKSA